MFRGLGSKIGLKNKLPLAHVFTFVCVELC